MSADARFGEMLRILDERVKVLEEQEYLERRSVFLSRLYYSLWEARDEKE